MNSALFGFCVGGIRKMTLLRGPRSVESALRLVLPILRCVDDERLVDYARQLRVIDAHCFQATTDPDFEIAKASALRSGALASPSLSWAELFACFSPLQPWLVGWPFLPGARLQACADVHWAIVLDVDDMALDIFDNRNARYPWHAVGVAEPPLCRIDLTNARDLKDDDLTLLQRLLHKHVVCDGEPNWLPGSDMVAPEFHAEGPWASRVKLQGGRASLLLARGEIRMVLNRIGELSLEPSGVGGVLRDVVEPEVLSLAVGIYGDSVTVRQVSQVARFRSVLPFSGSDRGLPLLDLGLRASNGLGLSPGPGFFEDLRSLLIGSGLTLQGWRFLIKQEQPVQRFLLGFFPPSRRILSSFTAFINLLASAMQTERLDMSRCQAALSGVERILDRTRGRPDPVREENARIFLRAVMRARLDTNDEQNLDHDTQDVSDFVYACAVVLKGVNWRSLRRRSDEWHRALLIEVDPARDVRWRALLPQLSVGPFEAVELDCGFLLAQEGLEQRHCIGTYVNACSSGASRIFSLRRDGKRVATLELQRRRDADWSMVQIRGKANSPVTDSETLQAAHDVAKAYAECARRTSLSTGPQRHPALKPGAYTTPAYVVHRQDHWTG